MGGHHPPEQEHREVDEVFERMHRDAGPWSRVGVAVVYFVCTPVDGFPVQESVVEVEVRRPPEEHAEHEHSEVDGCAAPVGVGDAPVGPEPHGQRLVERPDGDAAGEAPEHVVLHLVAPEKLPAVGSRPALVELVVAVLGSPDVEPPVQETGDDREQGRVAEPDEAHPARRQGLHRRGGRCQPLPGHDGQCREEEAPREHQVGDEPLQGRNGARRPVVEGRVFDRVGWLVAAPGHGRLGHDTAPPSTTLVTLIGMPHPHPPGP